MSEGNCSLIPTNGAWVIQVLRRQTRATAIRRLWLPAVATLLLLGQAARAHAEDVVDPFAVSEPVAIYFIAGFASAFDDLDKLDRLFAVDGLPAKAFPPMLWRQAVRDAEERYRLNGDTTRIILVGHSFGGNKVYRAAQRLAEEGIPVALIIGFDQGYLSTVSANVARSVNFFITPDVNFVVPGEGFEGLLVNEIVADETELDHGEMIYDPVLHQRAVEEIRRAAWR